MTAATRPHSPQICAAACERTSASSAIDAEVQAHQRSGRQRVGHAALEDQVDVHQAVAHDRPAERQRKQDQREQRDARQRAGHVRVCQERDDVQRGEREHRQQGAARQPLQLLPLQRLLLRGGSGSRTPPRPACKSPRGRRSPSGPACAADARSTTTTRRRSSRRHDQHDARDIEKWIQERRRRRAASSLKLMAKCRNSAGCSAVAITLPVRIVMSSAIQHARVLEGVQDERDQTEDVKVGRLRAPSSVGAARTGRSPGRRARSGASPGSPSGR